MDDGKVFLLTLHLEIRW